MDIGFELYSKGHLIWLLVLAVASLIMVPAYLRSSEHKQSKIRKIFALFLLISEIIKDTIIVIIGAPIDAYLPLHLCGYAIFFVLIDAFMPKQKVTGQLIAYAFGPGALAALLFCSWTMALLAVPAYLVDMKTGYNYMFIYEVQRNSPLEIAWEIFGTRFGKPGYVVGAMLLVIVIFHALYLIYGILGFRRRKR